MLSPTLTNLAAYALTGAVAVGIAVALALTPLLGTALADMDPATGGWIMAVLVLGACLGLGLALRRRRPVASTLLLIIGAAAPSLAWYWLPPVHLLGPAIIVLALVTTPRARVLAHSPTRP
jgi:hypothetical protein